MNENRDYTKVFVLIVLLAATLGVAMTTGQILSAAPTDQPGIKDPALATLETNEKLSQIVEELKTLNAKTQAMHDLLKGGKVEVVVRQGVPAAAHEVK
jgi:hypothetical protein